MSRLAKDAAAVTVAALSIPPPAIRAASTRALTAAITEAGAAKPCAEPGADPEDWFPLRGDEGPVTVDDVRWARARAQALCGGCPVMAACREHALRGGPEQQWGLAGGLCSADRLGVYRLWARLAEPRSADEPSEAAHDLPGAARVSRVTSRRAGPGRTGTGQGVIDDAA